MVTRARGERIAELGRPPAALAPTGDANQSGLVYVPPTPSGLEYEPSSNRGRNANAPTSRSIARRMRLFRSPVETTEPLVLAPCLAVAALERFFAIDFSSSLGRSFSEAMPLDVTQVELKHYRDCKKLSNSLVRRAPLHDDLLAFWHKETLFPL